MRLALDTNILLYVAGLNDAERGKRARDMLAALDPDDIAVPVQVLGEFFAVMSRKTTMSRSEIVKLVEDWADQFTILPSTEAGLLGAADLVRLHGLAIWDALILTVAAEDQCSMLLSEDMHNGFVWRGVTVVNPFADPVHPLLADLLSQTDRS